MKGGRDGNSAVHQIGPIRVCSADEDDTDLVQALVSISAVHSVLQPVTLAMGLHLVPSCLTAHANRVVAR